MSCRATKAMMAEWERDGWVALLDKHHAATGGGSIEWRECESNDPGVWCSEGTFVSPLAHRLPQESREATFLFVRRASSSSSSTETTRLPPTKHIMLHMAPTGTTTYTVRDKELARPLLHHGIASVIVMPPFYGPRAPVDQPEHYIDNVADYMMYGVCVRVCVVSASPFVCGDSIHADGHHISRSCAITTR